MAYTLSMHHRLTVNDTSGYYIAGLSALTHHAQGWIRSTRAIGGYWQGDFFITPDTMSRTDMQYFFNHNLGRRVEETTYNITTWEGEIVQMDITIGGVTYRRTLDFERWHNRVKVRYTDNATSIATATAWSENTNSSDVFGESEYIDTVGNNYDATSAAALRDRRLTENAYPKPIPVGGFEFTGKDTPRDNTLAVLCVGYVFSMNRRYRETDTAAANVSAQINTLVGESEFVTAGSIDTNTLQVPIVGSDIPFRLWDGIEEMIEMGAADGSRWIGGVYAGRKFDYKAAETAVLAFWRNGRLYQRANHIPEPSLIKPDMIVQIDDQPFGYLPSGGNVWDDTRRVYIEEVQFIAPNGYRLIPYGGDELIGA